MLTGRFRFTPSLFRRRMILEIEDSTRLPLNGWGDTYPTRVWEPATRDEVGDVYLAMHDRFGETFRFKEDYRGRFFLQKRRRNPAESPGDFHHYYARATLSEALTVFAMMKGRFRE